MERVPHIKFEQLADLAEGRLGAPEMNESLSHVTSCQQCSTELAGLKQTIGLMRSDLAENAPAYLIERVTNLFKSRATKKTPSLVQRLQAALQFDSWQMTPAIGLRAGQSAVRQMMFTAGEHDLDLRLRTSGADWIISGQVLGAGQSGQVMLKEINDSTETKLQAELNDLLEFTLPAAAAGKYQLVLTLDDMEIIVPEFDLQPK